jgi:hypothetical protein
MGEVDLCPDRRRAGDHARLPELHGLTRSRFRHRAASRFTCVFIAKGPFLQARRYRGLKHGTVSDHHSR